MLPIKNQIKFIKEWENGSDFQMFEFDISKHKNIKDNNIADWVYYDECNHTLTWKSVSYDIDYKLDVYTNLANFYEYIASTIDSYLEYFYN